MIEILMVIKKYTDEILYWLTIRIGTEAFWGNWHKDKDGTVYYKHNAYHDLFFHWMRGLHYFIWGWREKK